MRQLDEDMVMATLKYEIDEVKGLINELTRKQQSMEYTLIKMMKKIKLTCEKKIQDKLDRVEAHSQANQAQLGRIETLLTQLRHSSSTCCTFTQWD